MPKPQPKPLVSASPEPRDTQFKHFGVMNAGAQDKASLFTSITVNVLLALIIVIVGMSARKVVNEKRKMEATYPVAIKEKPPEPKPKPPPPKIVPPKPLPKPPEPPKIKLPDVKIPDPPKPLPVPTPKPVPVVVPAQPKLVVAAAAPKVVSVKMPAQSASVPNHDAHPTAVALGSATNPIAVSNRPATATVNLGNAGQPGMQASNTGRGPVSKVALGGNGSPTGGINGTGPRAVQGVALGVPGGTGTRPGGNGVGSQPTQVALGRTPPPPPPPATSVVKAAGHPPQVTYKPRPAYTADATQNHIEGQIQVRIRVSSSGAVTVLGIVGSGLGHGLDQSAMTAAQGIRFRPATDAAGNPIDWEGPVTITFQMA